jgi:hypothetical protein
MTYDQVMNLVENILDAEFSTPRTQKESEKRTKLFRNMLNNIFNKHFAPTSVLSILAFLGQNLLKNNPELAEIMDEGYIT